MSTVAQSGARTNTMDVVIELRRFLDALSAGWVEPDPRFRHLLVNAWPALEGSGESSMAPYKLERAERFEWCPPFLTFRIERHGARALGSTRAELQTWTLDLDARTASAARSGHKQLSPAARRVDVRPIAADLSRLIRAGKASSRLKWLSLEAVEVRVGVVLPDSGFKQTLQGRRKRLRAALIAELQPHGWQCAGGGRPWVFTKS